MNTWLQVKLIITTALWATVWLVIYLFKNALEKNKMTMKWRPVVNFHAFPLMRESKEHFKPQSLMSINVIKLDRTRRLKESKQHLLNGRFKLRLILLVGNQKYIFLHLLIMRSLVPCFASKYNTITQSMHGCSSYSHSSNSLYYA